MVTPPIKQSDQIIMTDYIDRRLPHLPGVPHLHEQALSRTLLEQAISIKANLMTAKKEDISGYRQTSDLTEVYVTIELTV